jgi:hypothetical protein
LLGWDLKDSIDRSSIELYLYYRQSQPHKRNVDRDIEITGFADRENKQLRARLRSLDIDPDEI